MSAAQVAGSAGDTVRERAMQAVEYYNSNVLRARVGAGLVSASRSSYNDRHHHQHSPAVRPRTVQDALYRSNSSLELMHDHTHFHHDSRGGSMVSPVLRREYGSHGSIDVIADKQTTGESFFAMLQDYRPAVLGLDQRSPGPTEYLRGKVDAAPTTDNAANTLADDTNSPANTSPKLRLKFHRFWSGNVSNNGKPARAATLDDSVTSVCMSQECEERQRRRAFAHYDVQSLNARLRGLLLLSRRRNTTTGASAASMGVRASTPDSDEDGGDGRSNQLLESCPFFRNEVGGEEERVVSLTRLSAPSPRRAPPPHRPPLACGVSVLEYPPGESHWTHNCCPYQRNLRLIECVDHGALYYRNYFYQQEHQNWFGMDENLGPVAISIKREKLERQSQQQQQQQQQSTDNNNTPPLLCYRIVIRTSELLTLRGSVLEDAIPSLKSSSSSKTMNTKEVLEYVAPEVQLSCLRLGTSTPQTEEQLLKLDEQGLSSHYKVGIMYCRAGQSTEEEMYNNQDAGPAFIEFLETIGQKVRLKGFDKYKAGLDNKTDSTGLYSVYSQYQDCEVMFHVSTLLPFTPNNRQQLLRKRHIGNDIVTIVFQEPGALPFTPKNIRSQFQHVFIIVRAINPCTENTQYCVAVTRSKEVPVFGPPIHEGATFNKSKAFADFLIAKVINAENAAHRSEKFSTMATRTRQEYLKDLVTNYSTTTCVETSQKFSMLSFSSKKKTAWKPRLVADATQRGAICWQVVLEDSSLATLVDCILAVSADTLLLVEEGSREIVFVTPCKSVLGWTTNTNSLRVYYHQGECMTVHMRENGDRDELMEVVVRLRSVTQGSVAQQLTLKRNPLGQLGFHVQPDGVVTQVESMGLAWQAGLRQGARLVEICKVAVSTLSHDQMVDLLKTSMLVTVTVIPPHSDGSARRGCAMQHCGYNLTSGYEGDYENLASPDSAPATGTAALQTAVPANHRRRYERSFSPPRSSNSSGYGTGSSSKSFSGGDPRFPTNMEVTTSNVTQGTMTSSSSGHSSDDRWYDLLEPPADLRDSPPPPLPARLSAFQPVNEFKVGEKVTTCLLKASERSHELRRQLERTPHDYHMVTRMPKVADYNSYQTTSGSEKSASLPLECSTASVRTLTVSDGHSTDTSSTSERLFGMPSEDELSASSSPGMRRGGTLTPSSTGSRNQSPRPRDTGEARLRPSRNPNRNSANLTNSTLQEDLIRLITPDASDLTPTKENGSTGSNKQISGSAPVQDKAPAGAQEVILTMARPATVISNTSTASSPAPDHPTKLSKEERLSPRVKTGGKSNSSSMGEGGGGGSLPLPDTRGMDWGSLVDTATRAMLQVHEHDNNNIHDSADDVATHALGRRMVELQKHLSQLEGRLSRETRRRLSLEEEVRGLKEENRRLQEESQSAAQQLRRFTEWFFQTIDRP
ncbi:signal-induced proliferation-associated 1-like protein 1 isoform X2 [Macrosteles quadrilineatus]|uniref:signal-induced proliferation-associated 1-like protein 1 isoform X2 n=1 Tax=Macrosteles quadrilineatus TaxID=74068 RepID=UPI0023E123E3|nr:signal-induced proliferation-associated 1-like protein 1 isoform X2 [Macrosteles quadrilineatus]